MHVIYMFVDRFLNWNWQGNLFLNILGMKLRLYNVLNTDAFLVFNSSAGSIVCYYIIPLAEQMKSNGKPLMGYQCPVYATTNTQQVIACHIHVHKTSMMWLVMVFVIVSYRHQRAVVQMSRDGLLITGLLARAHHAHHAHVSCFISSSPNCPALTCASLA